MLICNECMYKNNKMLCNNCELSKDIKYIPKRNNISDDSKKRDYENLNYNESYK